MRTRAGSSTTIILPSPAHNGIETRHQKACAVHAGRACNCTPSYRGTVYDRRSKKHVRSESFPRLAEARAWRAAALHRVSRGGRLTTDSPQFADVAKQWLAEARAGTMRNRSGDPFKPSVVRSYESSLRLYVLPLLGPIRLADLRRRDVQEMVDKLSVEFSASTVRNAINPLRTICRWALARDLITSNPCLGVQTPAVRGGRDRFATPEESRALIGALPASERAIWATAFYGGLRLGELQALRWQNVDLSTNRIRVEKSWDQQEGLIEPKSRKSKRVVPIPAILRSFLVAHRQVTVPTREAFVFARSDGRPFSPSTVHQRARRAWAVADLQVIGLHEARHTFASLMIAAMVMANSFNPKVLQSIMGHADITTTFDRYGKLMPGSEGEAADALDAYLEAAVMRAHDEASLGQPSSSPLVSLSR
jgi:integrase